MEKSKSGFLENVYKGFLIPELASPRLPPPNDAKVNAFLDRFREAASGFKERNIEEKHAIPPEFMNALRKTGMFGLLIGTEYGGLGFSLSEYLSVIDGMS
jgi:hypothetical protein